MKTMTHMLTTGALLALLSGGLMADTPVDESRPANPDARISLVAVTGEFEIVGSGDNRLTISGTLGEDVREFIIDGDAADWQIELKAVNGESRQARRLSRSRLTLAVPAGAEIEVRTVSGELTLLDLNGRTVNAHSVSGAITLDNVVPERLTVETVSGQQQIHGGGREETRLRSVSGNMTADNLRGRVSASSVSGVMELTVNDLEDAEFETVSGNVRAHLMPLDRSRIRASTHSGSLDLSLPQGTPLDLRANTFSGRIRSDFGGEVARGRGPGERLEHRDSDARVHIEAKSFSGRIHVTRAE